MKTFGSTTLFLFILILQGVAQTEVPNNLNPILRNPAGEYALINDLQQLNVNKEQSKVIFDFIEDETTGTIEGLDFDINFNPNDTNNAKFSGTATVETLDTGNFLRDGHLMWKKFFYNKKHPKITFESKQVVDFENDVFKVIGNLTLKGITKEIIITFTLTDQTLKGKVTLYTSDFDIHIHDERLKNKLDVMFYFPLL